MQRLKRCVNQPGLAEALLDFASLTDWEAGLGQGSVAEMGGMGGAYNWVL